MLSAISMIDTIYSLEYVYSIAGKKFNPAKHIIDSLERRERANNYTAIPLHRILLARGFVASRELHPTVSIYFTKKAFNMKELQQNADDYIKATNLLSNEYYSLSKIDESVKYSLLGMEKAKMTKKYKQYAISKINFWLLYSELKNYSRAIHEVRNARNILRTCSDADSTDIIWSFDVEGNIYTQMGKYEFAIPLYERILSIYTKMTTHDRAGTEVELPANMAFKIGQTHITLAKLYAYIGKKDIADRHYRLWKEFQKDSPVVISRELYDTVMEYLKTIGKFNEALDYSAQYQNIALEGDSINIYMIGIKRQLSSIYKSLNDYKSAWKYENQASEIADSLYKKANYDVAIEMATIYETEEQQSKIYEQQIIISRNRMYLSAILIFTFAVIILTFVIWINSKKISRKNRALFNQIEKLSALHNKIQNHRQPTANNENDLFVNLEKYMAEKQLFLNPDITRENVATTLNTNKNYLSNAIRDNLDLTFGEYLNLLRLEYAKDLLLNNLDIKVESVSFMSGFNSVRTFYRLFQKKYNLTPTEFKSIASQRNK